MDEWLSYRLSDLILFSPQTYYRMFEQYHERIFPAQVVLVASAIAVPVLVRRSPARAEQVLSGILAGWWLWVGIAFHIERYSTINWAARYFGALFIIQSLLLGWHSIGHRSWKPRPDAWPGTVLMTVAVLAPIASVLSGREWSQVELIAVTPDPTAVATLAFVLTASHRRLLLAVIPLLWLAIGGATLWALHAREAWGPLLAAIFAAGMLIKRRAQAS